VIADHGVRYAVPIGRGEHMAGGLVDVPHEVKNPMTGRTGVLVARLVRPDRIWHRLERPKRITGDVEDVAGSECNENDRGDSLT
jgi:hypothetical protein